MKYPLNIFVKEMGISRCSLDSCPKPWHYNSVVLLMLTIVLGEEFLDLLSNTEERRASVPIANRHPERWGIYHIRIRGTIRGGRQVDIYHGSVGSRKYIGFRSSALYGF